MSSNFCINCGAPLPENAKFCSACGTMIQQAPTQPPAQQPPVQQSPVQQSPVQQPPVQQPPVQQPPVQQQYEQQPAYPPAGGYDPNMPPPLTTEPPTQQPPQGGYYAPAGAPPPQFPPQKKTNGALIALIAVLALAVLGAGAWAIYNYVIKPNIEKTTEETVEDEGDHNSFSSDPDDETPSEVAIDSTEVAENIDSVETITEPQEPVPSIPEKTTPKVKVPKGDPWGMTDEEAAQNQRNRRGNVPNIPSARQQPPRNGQPWGMTDEEAAQNQRNRRGNVPSIPRARQQQQPRNGEPWGMTDEEAAQIRRNGGDIPQGLQNGDPWGMTDEEAAQMRKMQQRSNKKQKRRSRGTGGGVG